MFRLLFIFINCYLLALTSHAADPSRLWFGVEITNYAPYYYLDTEQDYQGAARDVFDLFSESMNIAVNYEPMAVPRLFNEFVQGNVDLKFPDNPLWSASLQSDVNVFYSKPIFQVNESLLILNDYSQEIRPQNIKQVGSILDFTVPGIAKNIANKEFNIVNTKKIEQLIHMLVSQRVQGIYFNEDVAMSLAKDMYPQHEFKRHSQYPAFKYAYHLSSIKHPNLIKKFDEFLISHKEQITNIKKRYGLK